MFKLSAGVHRFVSCVEFFCETLRAHKDVPPQKCSCMSLHGGDEGGGPRRTSRLLQPFMRSRCVGTELDRLQDSPALLSSRSSCLITPPYLQRHLPNNINSLQTTKACLLFRLHTAVLVCLLIRAFVLS